MGFLADIVADSRPRGAQGSAPRAVAPDLEPTEGEGLAQEEIAELGDPAAAAPAAQSAGPLVNDRSAGGVAVPWLLEDLAAAVFEEAAPKAPPGDDRRAARGEGNSERWKGLQSEAFVSAPRLSTSTARRLVLDPATEFAGPRERRPDAAILPHPSIEEEPHPLAPSPIALPPTGRGGITRLGISAVFM
ncbi:MAG: hypothetical protein ACRD1T_10700 [Acidimicrobiia bacterium]